MESSRESTVLSLRDQAARRNEWLRTRLETVVPQVMSEAGIDCWVLIAREYNEDPVLRTMLPATWEGARRRTILVFTDFGHTRMAVSRYGVGSFFPAGWDPESEPDQWQCLADYLSSAAPHRIAINRSSMFPLADGMTATETDRFIDSLPVSLGDLVVSDDRLAVGWLETRIGEELEALREVCARAHRILRQALSSEVVEAGDTTTGDVEWWLREESRRAGYETWFHPAVSTQRCGAAPSSTTDDGTIRHGDLVHIDFGIEYLGLHTDQQQHAYVLHPGERDAPSGLIDGISAGNRLQDIVMGHFHTGTTGNEILRAARAEAIGEHLRPAVYSHPIGLHGHGAGPTIGLWDQQDGVPGSGDYPIRPDTAYSIELSVEVDVAEWGGQTVRIMLEEDAAFDGSTMTFLDGRQQQLWLI